LVLNLIGGVRVLGVGRLGGWAVGSNFKLDEMFLEPGTWPTWPGNSTFTPPTFRMCMLIKENYNDNNNNNNVNRRKEHRMEATMAA